MSILKAKLVEMDYSVLPSQVAKVVEQPVHDINDEMRYEVYDDIYFEVESDEMSGMYVEKDCYITPVTDSVEDAIQVKNSFLIPTSEGKIFIEKGSFLKISEAEKKDKKEKRELTYKASGEGITFDINDLKVNLDAKAVEKLIKDITKIMNDKKKEK